MALTQPDPKLVGPLELMDGEAQLARTTWLWTDFAARKETAATSLVSPPLPLPTESPAGAVGDADPVGVGVGDVVVGVGVGDVVVGVGLGDVVGVGAGEHEADGAACLALAAGLVEAWCVGCWPGLAVPDVCGEPPLPFCCGAGFPLEPWPPPGLLEYPAVKNWAC